MNLYLDDVRKAPPGHHVVRSARAALGALAMANAHFEEASLDHDLGHPKMDGSWFLLAALQRGMQLPDTIHLHTQNPIGRLRMAAILEDNGYQRDPSMFATFRRVAQPEETS